MQEATAKRFVTVLAPEQPQGWQGARVTSAATERGVPGHGATPPTEPTLGRYLSSIRSAGECMKVDNMCTLVRADALLG
jgi:hypothetical protein